MARLPSSGDALQRKILAHRAAREAGKALSVGVSQIGLYVGVKRRTRPLSDLPLASVFKTMADDGKKGSVAMALAACKATGRRITSPDKAARAVVAELEAAGLESLWRRSKVKSGRPSRRLRGKSQPPR